MPLGPKCLTFVVGPKTVAPFFRNRDDVFSQPEVYGFMTQVFGKGVVYDATPPKRKAQNVNMSRGLRADRLKSYVPKILRETEAYFAEKWGESGTADLLVTLSELTILTASRCLHGDDVRENLFAQVSEIYHDLDKGITPLSFFWPTAPVEGHRKRDAARLKMVELFGDVIKARRRQTPEQAAARTDILQVFVDMVYKDGTKATDDEITGLLIALLFAGQHTSSVTSTWTQLYILADDKLAARVRAEQADVVGGAAAPLVFDDLNKMALLHNCMKEALRMPPPLIMLMRYVHNAFDVTSKSGETFTIPKGHIVATSPKYAMTLGSVFKEPEKYDPERFLAPREEDKAMPFSYIGFGGGRHGCMGETFAYMQIKVIWSMVIRSFDLDLEGAFPEPDFTAMVVGPKPPCKVRFRRRKL